MILQVIGASDFPPTEVRQDNLFLVIPGKTGHGGDPDGRPAKTLLCRVFATSMRHSGCVNGSATITGRVRGHFQ
jgi:hypothetical protein